MVHSQLPVLSLLCLLCALLLLPPELTLGFFEYISWVTVKEEELQKALAFAMPQFNQDRKDDANYFRLLTVESGMKEYTGREYHLKLSFLKTACKKTTGKTKTFREIQDCKELPGNPQKQSCYLKVIRGPMPEKMTLTIVRCT